MSSPVIETRGLAKRYGKVEALRGLDLRVERGEVYGFLGRNGAGKSTTIRIVMGITRPSAGAYRLFGQPGGKIDLRQRIGYVAQEQNFYPWMTPRNIGRFVRGFYPTWDDGAYARLIGDLDLPAERKIRTFSGGMKVKLALALALAHDPELLVLDEPTAGLDPVARREFLEMVRDQAESSGRTTFFSTHLIDEIELAAHRVGIVEDGRTRYEGSTADLAARVRLLRCPLRPDGTPPSLPDVLADPAAGFRVLQDRVATDRVATDRVATDRVATDRAATDRVATDRVATDRVAMDRVAMDRRRAGERQVVVESTDPHRFALLPYPPWVALEGLLPRDDWTLEELPLEEIFIEMVRKPLRGSRAT